MITRQEIVRDGWIGVAVALGILCGVASMFKVWMPVAVVIGVIYLLIGLYYPQVMLVVLFASIMLDAFGLTSFALAGLPITASKLATASLIGVWALRVVLRREQFLWWSPLTTGLLLVIATMVLSLLVAAVPSMAYVHLAGVIMLTLLVHFIYRILDPEDLPSFVRALAAFMLVLCVWTLINQRANVVITPDNAWNVRTTGGFGDANDWATALVMICPFVISGLTLDKSRYAVWLLGGLWIAYPACMVQSFSRAGFLAFIVTLPFLIYIMRDRKPMLIAGAIGFVVLLPFVADVEAMVLRYVTLVQPELEADMGYGSLQERTQLLEAGLLVFKEHWLRGIGVGMFPLHAAYVTAGAVWKVAHNSYVTVACEQGVPGMLSHAYFAAVLVWCSLQGALYAPTKYLRNLGVGFFTAVVGFSVMALTLNLSTFALAYFMFGVGLVITRATRESRRI